MTNLEANSTNIREKSYRCPEGPFAWLNDIEISKAPYLVALLLLIVNILLIRQDFFIIDIPYMDSVVFALHEVSEFSGFSVAAMILGIVSVLCLLVPLIKFFEWKYMWFVPAMVTAGLEIIAEIYLLAKKSDLMTDTLIGHAYELLSIEINLTASAWLLLAVNIALVALSVKMLIDVKDNARRY